MIKKIFHTLLLFFVFTSQAQARIYISIDEASEKKFPLAVPSFVTESGKSGGNKKLLDLIKKDLKIAGLFQVLDDSVLPYKDNDVSKIDFAKWKAIEVGAVVKGIVKEDGAIEIRLYDVGDQKMIMGKRYVLGSANAVDVGHRMVDSLMEALTGIRGPFESKIAGSCGKTFKRRIGLYEMDSERRGGAGGKGGQNDISPAIAFNGKDIAYASFGSGNAEIYIAGRGQITNFGSTTITPAWTPDGNLVIASAKTGDTDLYLINTSGNILNQITRSSNIDFNPSVSPDGRIVFSSERSGGLHLFSTGIHGGGASQLTYTGYQNDQPDWAPDGSKIVFSSRDQGTFDIFMMDSDGSNLVRQTFGEGSNESPVFSPDSRYIAYANSQHGIVVMLEDGTNKTIVEKSTGCINLDWGPWLSKE